MNVIKKDATITNTGTDADFPGTFRVILSAPTKDRDGDTLLADEWKTPLPNHITFDTDHGMSVSKTVGSGVPSIDPATGNLIVDGTYTSLPRGQETRTLVKEGHIKTTSVAFMTEKTQKDGVTSVQRELLNGAFVAIPSNREALVLSSKAFTGKAVENHYTPAPYDANGEGQGEPVTCPNCGKGDALDAKYCDQCGFELAGADGVIVASPTKGFKSGARNSAADAKNIQAIHDLSVTLGASHSSGETPVKPKSFVKKDATPDPDADRTAMISGIDAALDEAQDVFSSYDLTTLPADIQQAIALVQAAGTTVDELMDVVGIPDPDEEAEPAATVDPAAAAKAAAAASTKAAADAKSDAVTEADLMAKALQIKAAQFI